MHSGGHHHSLRGLFSVIDGKFHCGQVNVLVALTDIGPGDGGTVIIPGSHKSNFPHPDHETHRMRSQKSGDVPEGAVEIHMRAGDALIFVDTLCHGSVTRANPGQRRTIVYRYGPSWGNFRHNYEVSEELLSRLTPERRQIVKPRSGWPPENVGVKLDDAPSPPRRRARRHRSRGLPLIDRRRLCRLRHLYTGFGKHLLRRPCW